MTKPKTPRITITTDPDYVTITLAPHDAAARRGLVPSVHCGGITGEVTIVLRRVQAIALRAALSRCEGIRNA